MSQTSTDAILEGETIPFNLDIRPDPNITDRIHIVAVDPETDEEIEKGSRLVTISEDRQILLCIDVNPHLGFELDKSGRIMLEQRMSAEEQEKERYDTPLWVRPPKIQNFQLVVKKNDYGLVIRALDEYGDKIPDGDILQFLTDLGTLGCWPNINPKLGFAMLAKHKSAKVYLTGDAMYADETATKPVV